MEQRGRLVGDVCGRFFHSGRLQLTLLVAAYLLVAYLTKRILIASPALWGARTRSSCSDQVIIMNEATEDVAAPEATG